MKISIKFTKYKLLLAEIFIGLNLGPVLYFLTSLILSNRADVEYLSYLALQHSPNLRHMELKNCDLSNDCRATIVVKGQALQHISLIKCKNDFSSEDVLQNRAHVSKGPCPPIF